MDPHFRSLNSSIGFDKRLVHEDIDGSLAWVEALERRGLLSGDEAAAIGKGLETVRAGITEGKLELSEDLEDIHMNVESLLTEVVGEAAAKLHTGRSRNEQVATDLRLYLRRQANQIAEDLVLLIDALTAAAERNIDIVIPAYTHLQRAQPILFAHHLLAYVEMFLRDRDRFLWAAKQANVSPLGAGACAGNQFGLDREFLQERLGFGDMTRNSLDAVSDRDFVCDFLHASMMFMVHISRLSEDVIFWSSSEFGFVELDESVSSGSSMLPQKKNPDACELGRGKCGRVVGHLVALVTTLKGLPLSYNKDLQEDKEGVFDAIDTVSGLIPVFRVLLNTIRVNPERAEAALEGGFLDAISVADYLTRKGIGFRTAHTRAGEAVRLAVELDTTLAELSIEDYRKIDPAFSEDLYEAITTEAALETKDVIGGTAPERVRAQIQHLKGLLHDFTNDSNNDSDEDAAGGEVTGGE
jgi:argininosuccinate lyase